MRKSNLALFLLFIFLVFPISSIYASQLPTESRDVRVSAFIGEGVLELFGYGPPNAKIKLEGSSIYESTTSNKNGYFIFKNVRIKIQKQQVCLQAYTKMGASSQPVCLTIPLKKYVRIGPIILPPIVSLNKRKFTINDFAIIEGSTVPNTAVSVKFFRTDIDERSTNGISLPKLETKSNNDGQFSVNVPSNTDQRLRFYAQTELDESTSGKSTTLTIDILPLWQRILRMIAASITSIKDLIPTGVICIEVIFILWYIYGRKKIKHELMIREDHLPTTENRFFDGR